MTDQTTPLLKNWQTILLLAALTGLAIVFRLSPHMPNATPIAALALFAGFLTQRWLFGALCGVVAMAISDLFIGSYDWITQASVYVGISLYALFSSPLVKLKSISLIPASLISAFAGSICFFVITNFAVWAGSNYYPHTLAGLVECFTLAIPFYRMTLLGDLAWTAAIFTSWYAFSATRSKSLSRT